MVWGAELGLLIRNRFVSATDQLKPCSVFYGLIMFQQLMHFQLVLFKAGIYWFTIFDYQSAGVCLIFVAFVEIIVVGWFFDADRLLKMVEQMVGYTTSTNGMVCSLPSAQPSLYYYQASTKQKQNEENFMSTILTILL